MREYLAKTKGRENRSKTFFVTRKMDPALAVSNSTMANWLKETLIPPSIRALGGSTRKVATSYTASQGASIKTIMEAGDWPHTFTMYGYYIRCLPRVVLARITEQTSGSI